MNSPALESARNFGEIYDYFDTNIDERRGKPPSLSEFINSLKASANGSDDTIREYGVGPGFFDSDLKGGRYFVEMSQDQIFSTFEICVEGARLELSKADLGNWFTSVGFADVISYLITDGNYDRRPQLDALSDDHKRELLSSLEQLAIAHEQKATDLTRTLTWTNPAHERDICRILHCASDFRGLAVAITDGKFPETDSPN